MDPIRPYYAYGGIGWAFEMMGRYEEAITYLKKAVAINPTYLPAHLTLVRCYAALERHDEARSAAAEVLRLDPEFSAKKFYISWPYKDQAIKDRYFELSLKAGLPE